VTVLVLHGVPWVVPGTVGVHAGCPASDDALSPSWLASAGVVCCSLFGVPSPGVVAGGCLGQQVRGQGHAPDKYQLGMEPAAYVCGAVMA
jgi:hypothetical protein